MSEIKTDLIKLTEGKQYVAGPDQYLITENHTLSDIIRFLIDQSGEDSWQEIHFLIDMEKDDRSKKEG